MDTIDRLRKEIAQKEAELADLRTQLVEAEKKLAAEDDADGKGGWKWPLEEHEYRRYSRQMIVPDFGLQGIFSLFTPL